MPSSAFYLRMETDPVNGIFYFTCLFTQDMLVKVQKLIVLNICLCLTYSFMIHIGILLLQSDGEGEEGLKATNTVLGSVLALAFSPTGDLFIAESDSRKVNAIRVVDSAGRISDFAGRPRNKLYRSGTNLLFG